VKRKVSWRKAKAQMGTVAPKEKKSDGIEPIKFGPSRFCTLDFVCEGKDIKEI
jgi:hypothetical protein